MTDEKAAAILDHLYYLFGKGAVFIPVLYGRKRAVGKWKRTFEQTQTPEYQAKLLATIKQGGNIGVILGPVSGGICAIDCDFDDEWRLFLAENPYLAGRLRTRGAHGGQVFFKMQPGGNYPNSQAVYPYYLKGCKEHMGKAEALKWLRYYNHKCEPPWSENELEHKVDDALKAPHEKPLGYLLDEAETNNPSQASQAMAAGGSVDWNNAGASSANSTNSTQGPTPGSTDRQQFNQPAIYPEDSILHDYMQYGISQTEGVDAYILGSVLPIAAALIGRRVYFRLPLKIYPNLFVMLAGAAGDRKSSTIKLADELAKSSLLPPEASIPLSFSPETLFDEFDTRPDKLWIVDDANIVLTDWNKTANGERVGARFLELYDCCQLSESFRRNKKHGAGPRRLITETSTSVLFGATFNAACFQGQGEQIRKGMSRRFQFYVGDGHGRIHTRPQWKFIGNVANTFNQLMVYSGEIRLAGKSEKIWDEYQYRNRELKDRADRFDDAERARLNSAPTHVMKIATIFELARAAKQNPMTPAEVNVRLAAGTEPPQIRQDTLELAIAHVDECLKAARFLDKIANQAVVAAQAEVLIAKIRNNFGGKQKGDTILLSRTILTDKYAHNPDRQGSVTPDDLYLRIIPELMAQGVAKIHSKSGKLEIYAFKKE